MRVKIASAVGLAAGLACALAGIWGPMCNPAWANTSSPPVLGIDVYGPNGTMNWGTIASNGIQFAWAKATQGNYYEDDQLANNESGATANGVYIGAYDFADPSNVAPLTEATYFVNFAKQYGSFNTGKLLPALDMEQVGSTIDGASSLTAWINAWSADVYTLASVKPLIYCSPSFLSEHNITSTGLPLWEADWTYPSNLSNTGPPSGSWSPWSTWTFWQYSDKGSVGGDPSTVDLDAYNGNLSSMVANELIPALTWTGNSSGTWNISSTGTQNWNYGSTTGTSNEAYYYDGRGVIFQDTNLVTNGQVTNSTITISSAVTPQSISFTNKNVNYTLKGAAILGSAGITLSGTGSVTLDNGTSGSPNTFTGAVAIGAGQLILQQPWSLGNSSGASVTSGAALALSNTSGNLMDFGNLGSGSGTIGLTISGAGLTASPAGAINSTGGNNVCTGPITLSANATIDSSSSASGAGLALTGGIQTNGHTLTFGGVGNTTVSSAITGGALTMNGSGAVTLAASNTLSGTVAVNSGQLILEQPSSLGNSSGATVTSGAALALSNSTGSLMDFGNLANGSGTISVTIAGTGLTASPAGAINSTGGNNVYTGPITLSANTTINSSSSASGAGLALTGGIQTNGHTLTFGGVGNTTVSSTITGGALTMSGSGTVTLSVANTLSGTVQINSGILQVTNAGALGTSSIALAGGTLRPSSLSIIGVNIAADQGTEGSSSGEQPEQIAASATAGVSGVAINNWNNFIITRFTTANNYSSSNLPPAQSVPSSSVPFTLKDSTGATTAAQVTAWTGGNSFSVYGTAGATPDAQLNNGLLGSYDNKPATFTISNLPYTAGYSVYVYFNNNLSAEDAVISVTSGSYTSSSYYVATEGQISATSSPFYTNGSSSKTAGSYLSSNYVEIPIPAESGSGPTNSFTVTLSEPSNISQTPGITAVEVVGTAGSTMSNPVTLSANSTINVTGVSSATLGTLSIGANTLAVTGASVGTSSPYTLTLGSTTLTGNATFNVADNSSGSGALGTLQLGAIGDGGHGYGITLTGPGEVALTSAGTYSGATNVNAGQLLLISGTALGNSSGATVASNAALVLDNTSGGPVTFGQAASGSTTIGLTLNGAGLSGNPAGALDNLIGSNTYAGTVSVGTSGAATISAASSSMLTLSGALAVPTNAALSLGGSGTVVASGSLSLGGSSKIQVNNGTLQLNPASASTIGSNVSVSVASAATLQLSGTLSALSDGSVINPASGNLASIANSGQLSVGGANEAVGAISGSGTTTVQAGANLTASQIVQTSLTIGAGSTVTIFPSGPGTSSATNSESSNAESAATSVSSDDASAGSNVASAVEASSADPFVAIKSMIVHGFNSAGQLQNPATILNGLTTAEGTLNLSPLDSSLAAEYQFLSAQNQFSVARQTLLMRVNLDELAWTLDASAAELTDGAASDADSALVDTGAAAMSSTAAVPEPSTWLLAVSALLGICFVGVRARASKQVPGQ